MCTKDTISLLLTEKGDHKNFAGIRWWMRRYLYTKQIASSVFAFGYRLGKSTFSVGRRLMFPSSTQTSEVHWWYRNIYYSSKKRKRTPCLLYREKVARRFVYFRLGYCTAAESDEFLIFALFSPGTNSPSYCFKYSSSLFALYLKTNSSVAPRKVFFHSFFIGGTTPSPTWRRHNGWPYSDSERSRILWN